MLGYVNSFGGNLQPGSRFIHAGLNPGDPGVKLNPDTVTSDLRSSEDVTAAAEECVTDPG